MQEIYAPVPGLSVKVLNLANRIDSLVFARPAAQREGVELAFQMADGCRNRDALPTPRAQNSPVMGLKRG
jgi:hypothetical protein